MPAVYEHFHQVTQSEMDVIGHANNVAYVEWMQAAAMAHSAAQGWSGARYQEVGCGWVVRTHTIEYLRPALAGDKIVVRTWVATMQKVTSLRRYQIVRPADRVLLATAETKWAFISFASGQPMRVLPEIAAAFEVVNETTGMGLFSAM